MGDGDSHMTDIEIAIGLLREVRETLRDAAGAAALHAENTAVTNDRLGRVLDAHSKLLDKNSNMVDLLARLDGFIVREEQAQALARATADLAERNQKAGVMKLLGGLGDALMSPIVQRIMLALFTIFMAWAGVRFGFVAPPAPEVTQTREADVESDAP